MSSENPPPDPVEAEQEQEERQLCLKCLAPNDPYAHFCVKCGAPLSVFAVTSPLERTLAEGAAYRNATEGPQKLIVVIGTWAIFAPFAIGGMAFFIAIFSAGSEWLVFKVCGLGALLIACFAATILWKVTANYMAHAKAPPAKTTGDDDSNIHNE